MGKTRHRKWYDDEDNFYQKRKKKKQKNTNQTHRQNHPGRNAGRSYPDEEESHLYAHLSVPQQKDR